MGVSKNRGTPKWMIYTGNPIKMDDLGGKPTIFGNIHLLDYFLVGNPYKSIFVTVTGWGVDQKYLIHVSVIGF